MDKDLQAPCTACRGYSNYVKGTVYMTDNSHSSKTLKEAIDDWYSEGLDQTQEEFWYDTVEKPKHYMLFAAEDLRKKQGIEVRDVITKLVEKVDEARMPYSPLFSADYVQMMQYLMRFMDKNGVEDLKKAKWYLDKLIEAYESDV
jgi:hypothetical protein